MQRRGRDRKIEIGEERKRSLLENLVVAWNMADPWIKPSMYIQICVHVYKIHLRKLQFYRSSCFGKQQILSSFKGQGEPNPSANEHVFFIWPNWVMGSWEVFRAIAFG